MIDCLGFYEFYSEDFNDENNLGENRKSFYNIYNGSLDIKTLISLNLRNNEIRYNISVFENLVNLEELNISHNDFYGSFKSFYELINLEDLKVDNTNIEPSNEL